ncbi:MAG: hypothetical protein ACTSUO_03860 [Candidatus Thorarchaeota archaeon]
MKSKPVSMRNLGLMHARPQIMKRGLEMGCKAEGAAQGYTLLGGIVLLILAIQMIINGINGALGGNAEELITVLLAVALILMALLSFDACGFVYWKIRRSGIMLALFGFISILIVVRGLSFDILGWLTNIGTLAGLMILIAGFLLLFRK